MPYADPTSETAKASKRRRDAKYHRTPKAKTRQRRYRATDAGREADHKDAHRKVATGYNQRTLAQYRTQRLAYREQLFAPAPNKRIVVAGVKRLVVLSDLQIPFEDPAAVNEALSVIAQVKPDTIVLNGDVVDCYQESAFLKDWRVAATATFEQHRKARALMATLQHIPQKIWLGGNHEERWWRTVKIMQERDANNPVVRNLLVLAQMDRKEIDLHDPIQSFSRLFGLEEYGFRYYPYSHRLYFADDNLVVTHGKYVSRHSGYTAKRTFEWLGRSCIVGHTHRLGAYLVTQDGRSRGAWENGCLCQLEPEYDDAPNWQQGFSVVRISGPEFHVIQVPIVRQTPGSAPVAVYEG